VREALINIGIEARAEIRLTQPTNARFAQAVEYP